MFEHFTTLEEIYCYKLALARTMLQGSIDALDTLEETAMRSDLEDLFRDSAHATRHQLQNLQGCFSLPDQNTNDAPSAAAKGLNRETNAPHRQDGQHTCGRCSFGGSFGGGASRRRRRTGHAGA